MGILDKLLLRFCFKNSDTQVRKFSYLLESPVLYSSLRQAITHYIARYNDIPSIN